MCQTMFPFFGVTLLIANVTDEPHNTAPNQKKMKPSKLWKQCLAQLTNTVPESEFKTWLRPLITDERQDRLILKTHSPYAKRVIESEYLAKIRDIAHTVNGEPITVNIKTLTVVEARSELAKNKSSGTGDLKRLEHNLPFGFGKLNNELTFDRHVIGESNQLARSASVAVSEEPGRGEYNPLFLHGPVGVGKTHLMQAAGHAILKKFPNAKLGYVQSSMFVQHLVTLLRRKDTDMIERFKNTYRQLDVLLVDDIHLFAGANASQQEFLLTFNTMLEGRKQVIITSDRFFKELDGVEDRLISRFGAGLSIPIKPPELETRIAILESKAEERGVFLPHEVSRFLAEKISTSVRELEGALNVLCANHRLSGESIDINSCKTWLSDLIEFNNRPIEIDEIKRKVAHYFGVRVDILAADSRKAEYVKPRYVAMALARNLTTKSTIEIGKRIQTGSFGGDLCLQKN